MTITYERITRTTRCSTSWCELPADHDLPIRSADDARLHAATPAPWENDGRRVRVEIEATAKTADGVETVQSPGINLYVRETGADDLIADQARTLAAFVSASLDLAADKVEQIIHAGDAVAPA
jgi:hypothetical protein